MFFNTHAFIASSILNSNNPLAIVGSVFPDIAITKLIGWQDGFHDKNNLIKFSEFVASHNQEYIPLAQGIITHFIVDNYSHNNYMNETGFAFQNNERLVEMIKYFYDIDNQLAATKAHNYIESAVDYHILQNNLWVQNLLKNSIEEVDINKLSKLLEKFFDLPHNKTKESINVYFNLILGYDLSSVSGLLKLWGELEEYMNLKNISVNARIKIIKTSITITKETHKEFVDFSINNGGGDYKLFN